MTRASERPKPSSEMISRSSARWGVQVAAVTASPAEMRPAPSRIMRPATSTKRGSSSLAMVWTESA